MLKKSLLLSMVLVLLLSITTLAQAEYGRAWNGYTLDAPYDQTTCAPSNLISTTGIEPTTYIHVWFFVQNPVTNNMDVLQQFYHYGDLTNVAFPYALAGPISGTRLFEARVDVFVGGVEVTQLQAYWTVTCSETPTPPPGGQGCTPGFWRNHYTVWPAPYTPSNYFDTVFGVGYFSPTYTLGQAIWAGGGGLNIIARHGTAALLSAASPGVDYPYTVAEVIAMVQSGDISALIDANNLGCPLN